MSKILIIDDDPQVCELISVMLNFEKHAVEIAYNAADALKLYKSHHHDLIITDILMPGKDGIDTICELMELNRDVPIIAMSGGRRALSSDFNLDSAKLVGAKVMLKKPFTDIQLKQAVKQAMA